MNPYTASGNPGSGPGSAGRPVLADRDLVHSWVRVADFGAYIGSLRERFEEIPKNLDSGIGYVYVDHDCGISLKIEQLYRHEPLDRGTPAMVPLDGLVSLRLRYSALKLLDLKPLTAEEARELGLPEMPGWAYHYESADQKTIRELDWLDPFRAHGFFDDVLTILPGIGGNVPELVWVRLEKYLPDTGRFRGTLLNEPIRDYGIHRDDLLEILPARGPGGVQLVLLPRKRFGSTGTEGGNNQDMNHDPPNVPERNRS
jgi:hypothetical protein